MDTVPTGRYLEPIMEVRCCSLLQRLCLAEDGGSFAALL